MPTGGQDTRETHGAVFERKLEASKDVGESFEGRAFNIQLLRDVLDILSFDLHPLPIDLHVRHLAISVALLHGASSSTDIGRTKGAFNDGMHSTGSFGAPV